MRSMLFAAALLSTTATAAPMPRLGSLCEDSVWRVPKLTSPATFARNRSAPPPRRWQSSPAIGRISKIALPQER